MCDTERLVHVRLPEVLASKLDRFAESEGMTQSELVRQALRVYFARVTRESAQIISGEVRPKLEADGVREENAESWYKRGRRKTPQAEKREDRPRIARSR